MIGIPKAAVLPVPVWAWPTTSRPSRTGEITDSWIGVGAVYPILSRARDTEPDTTKLPNGLTGKDIAGAESASGRLRLRPRQGRPDDVAAPEPGVLRIVVAVRLWKETGVGTGSGGHCVVRFRNNAISFRFTLSSMRKTYHAVD